MFVRLIYGFNIQMLFHNLIFVHSGPKYAEDVFKEFGLTIEIV
jgi:hypothetical protein